MRAEGLWLWHVGCLVLQAWRSFCCWTWGDDEDKKRNEWLTWARDCRRSQCVLFRAWLRRTPYTKAVFVWWGQVSAQSPSQSGTQSMIFCTWFQSKKQSRKVISWIPHCRGCPEQYHNWLIHLWGDNLNRGLTINIMTRTDSKYSLVLLPRQSGPALHKSPRFGAHKQKCQNHSNHTSLPTYCMFISSPSKSALYGGVLYRGYQG